MIQSAAIVVLVLGFDLSAIASIGSAVALMIFVLITLAHLRVRNETGANVIMLVLALVTATGSLLTFVFTTLVQEPASIFTLLAILVGSVVLDLGWSRLRSRLDAACIIRKG